MEDLISRQKAIKMLRYRFRRTPTYAIIAMDIIKELPPAKPEIIRCRDCKHFEYDHPYVIQGVPVLGHEVCSAWGDGCKTDENGYCFLAERRTDETD